jgi:CelD/BcsL family acetyltransferase involved in cellulose biosynthesis
MTMAAVMESPTATRTTPNAGRIAAVEVVHDLQQAESIWRGLEQPTQLSTPYQRFDFQSAWQHHVGQHEGLQPFFVVAYDAERQPLLLLPLAVAHENGVRVAKFLGGKHVTFNMPLLQRDFAASATSADLDTLIQAIAAQPDRPDVLALTRQPLRWLDLDNPMALLSRQASTNDCPLLTIAPNAAPSDLISNSFRRRLKGKERKLQVLPGYRYCLATSDAEIKRVLDAFFIIKPQRMAEQNLPNVFADPCIEAFIRDACLKQLPNGGRAIEIHALECDDEVIAMFAGVADGHRFSMMFNTYTLSEASRHSPGLILMRQIIDYYAEHGYTTFDLGIGSDEYKRLFCKDDQPIFDSYIPLTMRGKVAAIGMSSFTFAKRMVKQNPALMQMAQVLRGAFHR